ncbi:MarR family winged helix-turn-helix transcriptional regulator [Nocardioides limicola]|uniref:MarR family winged helix-turn-helix transcriptional regulator n=1 Tax=Nocardioides limicola TaxID=2803368 RepID=UPI00193B3FF3|nr:MarR family winged helix-turn-helix transcriptional regulator [Nocardioides sp. DJM-14]
MTRSAERLSESEMIAWRTFMEMQEVLRGRMEQQLQADSGLSSTDYTVLVALSEEPTGQLRAVNLAQRLQWEKSRLHHHLTRMCQRGLVERRSGEGRSSLGAITPEGLAALQLAVPAHTREVRRMVFDRLSEQQVQQLTDISRAILDGFDRDLPS